VSDSFPILPPEKVPPTKFPGRGVTAKFPFLDLGVNESFIVDYKHESNVANTASVLNRYGGTRRYVTRRVCENGENLTRVYRTA